MKNIFHIIIFSLILVPSNSFASIKNKLDSNIFSLEGQIDTIKSDKLKIGKMISLGWNYGDRGYVSKQLDILLKALDITKKEIYVEQKADVLYALGVFYNRQEEEAKAVEVCLEALNIYESINDTIGVSAAAHRLGLSYYSQKDYEKAERYLQLSYDIRITKNFKYQIAASSNALGLVKLEKNELENALVLFKTARKYWYDVDDNEGVSIASGNIGRVFQKKEMKDSVIYYYKESIYAARESNALIFLMETAIHLSKYYEIVGEVDSSLAYLKVFISSKDSLFNMNSKEKMLEMESKYKNLESEKKIIQQQSKIENQESENKFLIIVVVFIIVILVLVGYLLKSKSKINKTLVNNNNTIAEQNEELNQQNEEISTQRDMVENQNNLLESRHQEIKSSIDYAQKIQSALLNNQEHWDRISQEYFILFMPRDVVSGDFYWAYTIPEKDIYIWAVADCTGHGVPGAFMSMLGVGFLNEIVVEGGETQPNIILDRLREKIIKALEQKGSNSEQNDGMDIAICVLHKKKRVVNYSGAYNPFIYIRNNEIFQIKGDKQPIGNFKEKNKPFINNEINLQENDSIYIFSDGYADQFGGDKDKKFGSKRFKQLLLSIQDKSMKEQNEILKSTFENWIIKGGGEQIDDVCVMGIKI